MYGNLPLYPGQCPKEYATMSMPLFEPCRRRPRPDPCGCACSESRLPLPEPRRPRPDDCCRKAVPVRLVNPCNPCEQATVLLSVDECGNLQICVRRDAERMY